MFSFTDSRFSIHSSKEGTARVTLWREYKIPNIFTLEASFYGYDNSSGIAMSYTIQDYINIGKSLCQAIYVYMTHVKGISRVSEISFQSGTPEKKLKDQPGELQAASVDKKVFIDPKNLVAELNNNNEELLKYGDLPSESGSDSEPSEDELPKEHLVKILPKKMRSKIAKKLEEERSKIPKKSEKIESAQQQAKTIEISSETPKSNLRQPSMVRPSPSNSTSQTALRPQTGLRLKTTFSFKKRPEIILLKQDKETQTEEFIFDMVVQMEKGFIQSLPKSSSRDRQLVIVAPSMKLLKLGVTNMNY